MTYKQLILKADRAEYVKDFKLARSFLKQALELRQEGSITKKMLRERIDEIDEFLKTLK